MLQHFHAGELSLEHNVFTLEGTAEQILTSADLEKPVGDYCTERNAAVHLRISALALITKSDSDERISIRLPNTKLTIEELIQLSGVSVDTHPFLAISDSGRVVDHHQVLTLQTNRFVSCKADDTCCVQITHADAEPGQCQRYLLCATMTSLTRR